MTSVRLGLDLKEVMTLLNKQLNIIIKLPGAILKQGSSNSDGRNNKIPTDSYGFTSYQINTILQIYI